MRIAKILAAICLLYGFGQATAGDCVDCKNKCCTEIDLGFLGKKTVCEPTCASVCAAANVGCGQIDLTPPTPVTPPRTIPPVTIPPVTIPPINIDPTVGLAILTGGMVNPLMQKATNDAIWNTTKALKDISANLDKAGKDAESEVQRAGRDMEQFINASSNYAQGVVKGKVTGANRALTRMREGKVIDALWHQATDNLVTHSDSAAAAAQESSILRTVGSVASSVYGGPGGAAAYAAWLAYYQSGGDVNLALRVGIISGATSYAMAGAGTIPTRDAVGNLVVGDIAKRAAVTGAIGGLAVAAAGGDENAVRDGFLRAGAMVLIQEGYRTYTKHPLSEQDQDGKPSGLKASNGPAYCTSSAIDCRTPPEGAAKIENGKFIGWDQSKLDPSAPHVGNSFDGNPSEVSKFTWPPTGEGAPIMQVFSKIPGVNAMGVFHDQWAVGWNMPPGVLQATIYPAVILTYNGTSAPLLEQIREQSLKFKPVPAPRPQPIKVDPVMDPLIVVHDETKSVPIREALLEVTYACAKPNDHRSIAVEVDPQRKAFACRVIYRAKHKRTIAWRAANDTEYCYRPAMSLANNQIDFGYSCVFGTATPRK